LEFLSGHIACPFCGSGNIVIQDIYRDPYAIENPVVIGHRVHCQDCHGGVERHGPNSRPMALRTWNRRHLPQEIDRTAEFVQNGQCRPVSPEPLARDTFTPGMSVAAIVEAILTAHGWTVQRWADAHGIPPFGIMAYSMENLLAHPTIDAVTLLDRWFGYGREFWLERFAMERVHCPETAE